MMNFVSHSHTRRDNRVQASRYIRHSLGEERVFLGSLVKMRMLNGLCSLFSKSLDQIMLVGSKLPSGAERKGQAALNFALVNEEREERSLNALLFMPLMDRRGNMSLGRGPEKLTDFS